MAFRCIGVSKDARNKIAATSAVTAEIINGHIGYKNIHSRCLHHLILAKP